LVLKGAAAHLFHVGDTRVYRLQGNSLEQLTQDHRVQSYLSRAVGFNPQIEIDYHALEVERGDVFVLATDGVYEHVDAAFVARAIREARGNLDDAARAIVAEAYRRGSADNLTVQIVSVEDLPGGSGLLEQVARVCGAPLPARRAAAPPAAPRGARRDRRLPHRARDPLLGAQPSLPCRGPRNGWARRAED